MESAPSVDAIDALLPQTQCTRCGYAGCAPYAAAIASGEAPINRCPPGGDATVAALAALTGRALQHLDPACGTTGPLRVAVIDEARCIGCTLCIVACPVDAIIGAARRMHAVLPSLCSGCELCVAPCPVDCISLVVAGRDWTAADAALARTRHRARAERHTRTPPPRDVAPDPRPPRAALADSNNTPRTAAVAAALARARARRTGRPG